MRRKAVGLGALAVGVVLVAVSTFGTAATQNPFTAPLVMGYPAGDDWEPAVASDGQGNVYVLITHFGGVPGCGVCANPSIMIRVSHDGGRTFSAPAPMTVSSQPQYDPEVKISAAGSVFVSYLLGKDTVVQRSTNLGATWTNPVAVNVGVRQGPTDKDGLAVDGNNVYVGFDVAQRFFVAVSHDAGNTFTVVSMNSNTIGWTLNGGAAVGPGGTVYMSWQAVHQAGNALGPQDVLVTYSRDRGATWNLSYVDQGLPPGPNCGWPTGCGWDFLGTGSAIAVDAAGTVYDLYNAPTAFRGSPSIWLKKSTDGGKTWSPKPTKVNDDGSPAWHVFPALDAGAAGDVRVAWMDNRIGAYVYNVWYLSSSDGGSSWSSTIQVSQYVSGYRYVTGQGFAFPYGDYFVLDLDPKGQVHIAWGEGPSYAGPGNVMYAHN